MMMIDEWYPMGDDKCDDRPQASDGDDDTNSGIGQGRPQTMGERKDDEDCDVTSLARVERRRTWTEKWATMMTTRTTTI